MVFSRAAGIEDVQNAFLRMCKRRVFVKNKNLNILVVGESGDAKSYISMKLAEELDESFTINRVVFDNTRFIKIIDDIGKGNAIVLEELGVNAYNRNWSSYVNKALDHIFMTFRHKNLIVICNVPDQRFIDTHLRDQFHVIIWAKGVDHQRKLAISRIYLQKRNPLLGKTFYKRLPVIIDGVPYKLKGINFGLPSKPLREAYEIEMDDWKTELRRKFKDAVEIMGVPQDKKSVDLNGIVESVCANPEAYGVWAKTKKRWKLQTPKLMLGFHFTYNEAKNLRKKLESNPKVLAALFPPPKAKAYWEKSAAEFNQPDPVHPDKPDLI